MALNTKQVVLVSYAAGVPSKDLFKVVDATVDGDHIPEGSALVKVLYLSVDPYMRARMNETTVYAAPFELNKPLNGFGITKVVKSNNPNNKEGDILVGYGVNWANYTIINTTAHRKITSDLPLTYNLNVLGMTGLTAYFGLLDVCEPKAGETVVVSTAAGAVGYVVGQIAKIRGCKVVGITGSEEKVKFLKEKLHFDEVFNYKTSSSIRDSLLESLKKVNPENPKINVYFDNVGGETLDAVLSLLAPSARISICGQISQYNKLGSKEEKYGIKNIDRILASGSTMKGFMIGNFASKYAQALPELTSWVKEGKLQNVEDVVEGLENIVDAFLGLMSGENIGKRMVKVANE